MSAELLKEYKDGTDNFIAAAKAVPADKLYKTPANDEWSPANIIHHIADAEAHFYVRYLRVLTENLPTTEFFDENVYPELLHYEKRDVNASIALIEGIRAASISLFNNFKELFLPSFASTPI